MPARPESAITFIQGLIERARNLKKKIVFPEGADPRTLVAAERLARERVAEPILIGRPPSRPPEGVHFINPEDSPLARRYADLFYERRRSRGITHAEAAAAARQPLYFGSLMVTAGDAHAIVGGAANTTAEAIRAFLQCIGPDPKLRLVSSMYVMALQERSHGHHGLLAFADCAVVVEPTAVQLAEIAIATAQTTGALLGVEPVVALLSFSTKGSARHAQVDRVVEALRIVRQRAPDLHIDGEFQADAAVSEVVGRSKAPGSTVAGRANTLIFPNLAAANIGYKLLERLAGAVAIGPFLQGLAKPANDLSRGCTADDVFNAAVVTSLQ